VFEVRQVSPDCRLLRRFTVKGHAGRNRVRIGARRLGVGTYRIVARTVSGHLVRQATVVVLADSTPTRAQVASARAANVCVSSSSFASASGLNGSLLPTLGPEAGAPSAPGGTPAAGGFPGGNGQPGKVLGSAVERTARAIQPWLVALLAFAIALLALGSVPQLAGAHDTRLNDFLARRRVELVAVGTASLVAVIVAFLLG
jgi:hypothetical protein